jgi:hypothetical protein
MHALLAAELLKKHAKMPIISRDYLLRCRALIADSTGEYGG